jgi:hypothetical protein
MTIVYTSKNIYFFHWTQWWRSHIDSTKLSQIIQVLSCWSEPKITINGRVLLLSLLSIWIIPFILDIHWSFMSQLITTNLMWLPSLIWVTQETMWPFSHLFVYKESYIGICYFVFKLLISKAYMTNWNKNHVNVYMLYGCNDIRVKFGKIIAFNVTSPGNRFISVQTRRNRGTLLTNSKLSRHF